MKTLEETLQNLNIIEQNIEKLFNLKWGVVDPDSPCEAYYSLRAINSLLIQLIHYVDQSDDNNISDYFRRLHNNVVMTQEGDKSKEFVFSFTFVELVTKAREMLQIASEHQKSTHGGVRKGAGRKAKRPTKQIRVDEDLAESFKMMSDYYQSLDDYGRRDFDNRFSTSGLLFPNG